MVYYRDSNASVLSGIWLHRQQADDISSADSECLYSEEDDTADPTTTAVAAAAYDNDKVVPPMESSGQFLNRADIAVFDTLLSVTSEDVESSSRSNVELLSMLAIGDIPSVNDSPHCDGSGCGSISETDHGLLLNNDEVDGVFAADLDETLVADVSSHRPQTGSVIESGTGDLTMSPVHHVAASSTVQTVSLPNTHSLSSKSRMTSRSWKTESSSLTSSEETRYIVEAAELISLAQEHEVAENIPAAYSYYRSGIEILVKGVQSEWAFRC